MSILGPIPFAVFAWIAAGAAALAVGAYIIKTRRRRFEVWWRRRYPTVTSPDENGPDSKGPGVA